MKSLESAEDMCKRLLQNDAFCLPHPECCPSNTFKSTTCLNCEVLESISEILNIFVKIIIKFIYLDFFLKKSSFLKNFEWCAKISYRYDKQVLDELQETVPALAAAVEEI